MRLHLYKLYKFIKFVDAQNKAAFMDEDNAEWRSVIEEAYGLNASNIHFVPKSDLYQLYIQHSGKDSLSEIEYIQLYEDAIYLEYIKEISSAGCEVVATTSKGRSISRSWFGLMVEYSNHNSPLLPLLISIAAILVSVFT